MKLNLNEFIAILEELAADFIKENQEIDEYGSQKVPTYEKFEKYLIQNFGIDSKNQILDQDKWLHYILSRS